MKNDVRSKVSAIKNYAGGTGGGKPKILILNDHEELIQKLIGQTCISGHEDIEESDVKIVSFLC